MSDFQIQKFTSSYLAKRVTEEGPSLYREPLTGWTRADNPIFAELRQAVGPRHRLPADLLPGAKAVLAFFLPFQKEIVANNREGKYATRQWAEVYHQTNRLINQLCEELNEEFAKHGIHSAWLLPTYEFDRVALKAEWSHKHIAFACGLGTFGRNHQLITPAGCAGRFGTMVVDSLPEGLAVGHGIPGSCFSGPGAGITTIDPSLTAADAAPPTHACLGDTGCDFCQRICPVGALDKPEFDRQACYQHLLEIDNLFPDLESVEVCGKCSTGPCAFQNRR